MLLALRLEAVWGVGLGYPLELPAWRILLLLVGNLFHLLISVSLLVFYVT